MNREGDNMRLRDSDGDDIPIPNNLMRAPNQNNSLVGPGSVPIPRGTKFVDLQISPWNPNAGTSVYTAQLVIQPQNVEKLFSRRYVKIFGVIKIHYGRVDMHPYDKQDKNYKRSERYRSIYYRQRN